MTASVLVPVARAKRGAGRLPSLRPTTVIASAWLVLVALVALLAPVLLPQGPDVQVAADALQGPSGAHLLGTDGLGRDLLVRVAYGARPTLSGVVLALVIAIGLGAPAGLAGGYLRGPLDRVLSVVSDVLQAVPLILVLLVVFSIFPNSIYAAMAVFGLFSIAPVYRVIRGATLTTAGELYITAARSAGLSGLQILRRHLAPRLGSLIRVQASIVGAVTLVIQVGLGFLGLDVAPPAPSWGELIADGSQSLTNDPWMLVPPTVAICLTVLALGVLGDAAEPMRRRRAARQGTPSSGSVVETHDTAGVTLRDDTLLTVRDLTVTSVGASRTVLVDHVDFDVRRGEVVGLVGESGAGKSVTARAVLRLDSGVELDGSIRFGDEELLGGRAMPAGIRGRRIAYVAQDPMSSLSPLFRIESLLVEAIRNHRPMPRREASAEARRLLASVRIPDPDAVVRKYPFEISGGMAQRVAIALALAGDPELLIADEPTTALDVTVQMEVLGLLKTLQRERDMAIVLVTHDWGVVADMCDRAITMYAGEVVETGASEDVFALPSHPYTAALRRSDPHLQQVGTLLKTIPGTVPPPGARPGHCRFADRCPLVEDRCRSVHPPLEALPGSARSSRCIRTDELRTGTIHV